MVEILAILFSPSLHNRFTLFFGTFDAIVLMASIFILFPKENTEYVSSALQHFQWAMERFETMSERNKLAAAARNVLRAVYMRLKSALKGTQKLDGDDSEQHIQRPAPSASNGEALTPFYSVVGGGNSNNNNKTSLLTPAGSTTSTSPGDPFGSVSGPSGAPPIDPGLSGMAASDWTLPEGFHWSSIQPVYAMADVAYNDLMGISSSNNAGATTSSLPNWAGGTPLLNDVPGAGGGAAGGGGSQPWLFGGDFGNDSVWSLLNQYPSPY